MSESLGWSDLFNDAQGELFKRSRESVLYIHDVALTGYLLEGLSRAGVVVSPESKDVLYSAVKHFPKPDGDDDSQDRSFVESFTSVLGEQSVQVVL